MWIGYFDQFMLHVDCEPAGWSGLALPYHLHQGWYEHSPWTIPNVQQACRQLELVDQRLRKQIPSDAHVLAALDALLALLRRAADFGLPVQIEFD